MLLRPLDCSPVLVFSLLRTLVLLTVRTRSFFTAPAVFAPNSNPERDELFTSCLDFADPFVPTILCGDFNADFDRAKDRRGSDPAVTVRESFVSLELLFREFCVLDVWPSPS